MSHSLNMNVQTTTAEEWRRVWGDFNELADGYAKLFSTISVSSFDLNVSDQDQRPDEELFYDEQTLQKVRNALILAMNKRAIDTLGNGIVDSLINEMQNAGILFRERA